MKYIPLLFLLCGCFHKPFSKLTSISPPPETGPLLISTNTLTTFMPSFVNYTTNQWIMEFSTNGTTWTRCFNETIHSNGVHMTETGLKWADKYLIRLRKP